jgi:hypothetical protein
MFIPKRHRDWQPEHMKQKPARRCHWCASGPHAMSNMIQVVESPMRWHFCKDDCMQAWVQHRHDADVLAWMRLCAGDRAKILTERMQDDRT